MTKKRPGKQTALSVLPVERVTEVILTLRGRKVIVDADLARLYGVTTKRLNEQVKRNADRFPTDFMFELTSDEKEEVVAICDHLSQLRFSHTLPHAFTEHGALMAANVLSSSQAIQCSILVVRAFVRMRELLASHTELGAKMDQLEARLDQHDDEIRAIIEAIRQLASSPYSEEHRRIGFNVQEAPAVYRTAAAATTGTKT